jgi:hypothetical protein
MKELQILKRKMDKEARRIAAAYHPYSNIITSKVSGENFLNQPSYNSYERDWRYRGRGRFNSDIELVRRYSFFMKGKYLGLDKYHVEIEIRGKVTKDEYGNIASYIDGSDIISDEKY